MNQMAAGLNGFYGSAAQLRAYHARYLRFLEGAPKNFPVLDLGCGSGVFMELARERQRAVRGVDREGDAVTQARAKGLEVVQADALRFLEDYPNTFAFIYCSHLIEHFAYADACCLLERCQRALVVGGRLHVNTPNPVSLEVISESFWLDPTHVRPYPLALLAQMMQRAGFNIIAKGFDTTPALPRRTLARRLWLRLVLGRHYGQENSFIVGEKT